MTPTEAANMRPYSGPTPPQTDAQRAAYAAWQEAQVLNAARNAEGARVLSQMSFWDRHRPSGLDMLAYAAIGVPLLLIGGVYWFFFRKR